MIESVIYCLPLGIQVPKTITMQLLKYILLLSLWWIPRIFSILFAMFLAFFSMDVFGQGDPAWKTALALLMHNIPTILIVVVLVFSWKRSWLGAICFFIIGVTFFLLMPNKTNSLFLVLPILGTSLLFFLNWTFRAGIKKAKDAYNGEEQ